jgi:hypothetical protein
VAAARSDRHQAALDDRIVMGDYSVNVSRKGVVFLPGRELEGRVARQAAELVAEGRSSCTRLCSRR